MQIENEFIKIVSIRFSKHLDRSPIQLINLMTKQVWYRPISDLNSVGIILQHLSGNLNQWVCSAIGGESFKRILKSLRNEIRFHKKNFYN